MHSKNGGVNENNPKSPWVCLRNYSHCKRTVTMRKKSIAKVENYSSCLIIGGSNKVGVRSQHKFVKVGGGVTIKRPSGQAIILLLNWVDGSYSNFQYKTGSSPV